MKSQMRKSHLLNTFPLVNLNMNSDITCLYLWKMWSESEPDNKYVLEAKQRMTQYSKEDWSVMAEEATQMMEDMGISIKSGDEIPEHLFDTLCSHLSNWFFAVNKEVVNLLAFHSMFVPEYQSFLNKYADGLNLYMYRMCKRYVHKVPN
jgi:hypothetical protein